MTPPQWSVVVSPIVGDQIWAQVRFIARHSVSNALAWEGRVRAAIDGLANIPSHPTDGPASRRLGEPVCKLVFERTYLTFYRADEAASLIEVIWSRHGARLPRPGEP